MKIISHRGNLDGPDKDLENNPEHLLKVLDETNFDIEVDVWYLQDNGWFLGHDKPEYKINMSFLKNNRFWCHAKNILALDLMIKNKIHCFTHDKDPYAITSQGVIWAYPGNYCTNNTVCVLPELTQQLFNSNIYGVCTDFPKLYK